MILISDGIVNLINNIKIILFVFKNKAYSLE
jgi:hypothetical protein